MATWRSTLREAAELMRTLRTAATQADVPGMVAELQGTAADARKLLGSSEVTAGPGQCRRGDRRPAQPSAARLPGSMNNLDASLRSARSATTDIQAELAPILRDLRAAVANLRDTTEQLRRYPSQAIFGAPPPAPSESRR